MMFMTMAAAGPVGSPPPIVSIIINVITHSCVAYNTLLSPLYNSVRKSKAPSTTTSSSLHRP